ncbi:Protein INCREASED PETAL GROWTH ANISOTROPY 1 [Asimina triloba]
MLKLLIAKSCQVAKRIKLASVKLALKFMKRVSSGLDAAGTGSEEEELMLQGVRFAFRVHQFAGGFDVETMRAFQELRNKARSSQHPLEILILLGRFWTNH